MACRAPASLVVRSASLLGSVLLFLTVASDGADAGIGIPKKVKDAVGKSAEQKAPQQKAAPEEPVVFDDLTLELNEERVAAILAACQRVEKISAGRPPLAVKLDKVSEERQKLLDKNEEKFRELRNKRSDVETCRHDGFQAAQDRKTQEYAQRALTDPALREKYTKVAQEYNAAAMSGDSTAIRKAQEAMYEEVLPSKEDSAKVVQECGPMPPISAEEKKLDALDREIASIHEEIRALDEKIAAEQTSAQGGFTREQWGMAVERIEMFLSVRKQKPKDAPRGFSDEEIEAMEEHLEELKAAHCWS